MERFAALWGGLLLIALSSGVQPSPALAVSSVAFGHLRHPLSPAQSVPRKHAPTHLPTQNPAADTRPMPALAAATDPVCHMGVSAATKYRSTYKGKTYGFCSASCQGQFVAKLQQYVR